MAKPIKETPILTGKDAINFFELQKAAKDKKVTAFSAVQAASDKTLPNIISSNPIRFT